MHPLRDGPKADSGNSDSYVYLGQLAFNRVQSQALSICAIVDYVSTQNSTSTSNHSAIPPLLTGNAFSFAVSPLKRERTSSTEIEEVCYAV